MNERDEVVFLFERASRMASALGAGMRIEVVVSKAGASLEIDGPTEDLIYEASSPKGLVAALEDLCGQLERDIHAKLSDIDGDRARFVEAIEK